jgi:hypothetical protein
MRQRVENSNGGLNDEQRITDADSPLRVIDLTCEMQRRSLPRSDAPTSAWHGRITRSARVQGGATRARSLPPAGLSFCTRLFGPPERAHGRQPSA